MKENKFRGWQSVFSFTFSQTAGKKGFQAVTVFVAILIAAAVILGIVLTAKPEEKKEVDVLNPSQIKEVFLLEQTGLPSADYEILLKNFNNLQFGQIKFHYITDITSKEELAVYAGNNSNLSIAVILSKSENGYLIEAAIPEQSIISKQEAENLIQAVMTCFEINKQMAAELTADQSQEIAKVSQTSVSKIGEEENTTVTIIKMVAPMAFGFLLYFMLLFYGQSISKEVSTEKTSKLMDTLLTCVHPYGLIAGKVIAVTLSAIVQFGIWICSAIIGLFAGNAIAHSMYPEYQNTIFMFVDFLKENIGETALSIPSIILAIFIFCIGFLFYCVLAGLAGCMVTRPEEAASTQALFQFPIVISWLISYFAPLLENQALIEASRFIPFTAPFCVPVELITGAVSFGKGLISGLVLLVFCLLAIMLSARIYQGLVLYNGEKVTLKTIGKILKAEQ